MGVGSDYCEGSQRGLLDLRLREKMNYVNTVRHQVVRYNAPVTAPPDGLGTHDRARFARDHLEQIA